MMIGNSNSIRIAYNALTATNKSIEDTTRALITGQRAAHAADDASGLAISEKISSQIAGVDRAIRNSQDGISMLQTAEGALNQINSMLQRMRELTVQAANDTLTTQDRGYIQLEIGELRDSIDNIASNTTFNSKRLLDGSSSAIWSSDNRKTEIRVSGSVTLLDQFSQRKDIGGNYKLSIKAKVGQAEIQKTGVFDLTIAEDYTYEEIATDGSKVKITRTREKMATLEDMAAFRDPSGVFMVKDPQKITINQGDGKTANIILYSQDTLEDVRNKINNAIANDLGQGEYVDDLDKFCTIASGTLGTSEAVRSEETVYGKAYLRDIDDSSSTYGQLILNEFGTPEEITPANYGDYAPNDEKGYDEETLDKLLSFRDEVKTTKATIVIRSAVAGPEGTLTFTSDNNDLINALGLNNIQKAENNKFTVSIYDAHSGKTIANNIETDGNLIEGVISPNISIKFDSMANVKAEWDDATKRYILSNTDKTYETTLHIDDRSTSFQIGQNFGEDIYINIGDVRAEALGLNKVDVSTRQKASESITILDVAINKVASQRSRVGAYQNELEYNANSLTETSLHMQEAESRIKDADMAKEYLEFVKLQILSSSGSSMLTHANQNSQDLIKIMSV